MQQQQASADYQQQTSADYTQPALHYITTEEEMLSQVTSKARWNRSKSCHSRSNSLKKSKRKLAPDEDLITVVTDDPHHFTDSHLVPQPKPRTILTQIHRNGSASLGNIMIIADEGQDSQYLINAAEADLYAASTEKPLRQTLPRRHVGAASSSPPPPSEQLFNSQMSTATTTTNVLPKPSPRRNYQNSGYHRHPLSHSTETILYTDDRYDPNPIIPNSTPDVPDIWLPMRSVKA